MILDNARTVPLQLFAPRSHAISCTTLSGVKAPTLVVGGEQTPRNLALINEVVVQCIPSSSLVVVSQGHTPDESPESGGFQRRAPALSGPAVGSVDFVSDQISV